MAFALTASDLPTLTFLSKGKVRDIYATSDPDALLFVATDRISAYDVILKNVGLCLSWCTTSLFSLFSPSWTFLCAKESV
jgi:phosphoribosylaminoimidazole-succinocarboxamide synthase